MKTNQRSQSQKVNLTLSELGGRGMRHFLIYHPHFTESKTVVREGKGWLRWCRCCHTQWIDRARVLLTEQGRPKTRHVQL